MMASKDSKEVRFRWEGGAPKHDRSHLSECEDQLLDGEHEGGGVAHYGLH